MVGRCMYNNVYSQSENAQGALPTGGDSGSVQAPADSQLSIPLFAGGPIITVALTLVWPL